MNIDRLRTELNETAALVQQGKLAEDDEFQPWVLFGSMPLLLHGLRETVGDVDAFVTPRMWQLLANRAAWGVRLPDPRDPPFLERLYHGRWVHLFYRWDDRNPAVDALECRRRAHFVRGWPCTPLEVIRRHKTTALEQNPGSLLHAKHQLDVAAIDDYMRNVA